MAEPNGAPGDQPTPENPTLGRKAGYTLDAHRNVSGIWFQTDTQHYTEYADEAVTDPAVLAALRKPAG